MNCDCVRASLSAYIDGELSEIERWQVEHHLARCTACAEEEFQLRQTVALLHDVDEVDLPPDFRARLHARLVSLPAPAPARPKVAPLPAWRRWGLPAAAAAAVAALVYASVPRFNVMPFISAPPAGEPAGPVAGGRDAASVPAPGAPGPGVPAPVAVQAVPSSTPDEPRPAPAPVPPEEPTGGSQAQPPVQAGAGPAAPPEPAAPAQPPTTVTRPGGPVATAAQDPQAARPAAAEPMVETTHRLRLALPLQEVEARLAGVIARSGAREIFSRSDTSADGTRSRIVVLSVARAKAAELKQALLGLDSHAAAEPAQSADLSGQFSLALQRLQRLQEAAADNSRRLADPALSEAERARVRAELAGIEKDLQEARDQLDILRSRAENEILILNIVEARGAVAN